LSEAEEGVPDWELLLRIRKYRMAIASGSYTIIKLQFGSSTLSDSIAALKAVLSALSPACESQAVFSDDGKHFFLTTVSSFFQ